MEQAFTFFSPVWSCNKAKRCSEGKRKLNDWLPFLGGMAIALIMIWGTWTAFAVEAAPGESVARGNSQAGMVTGSNHSGADSQLDDDDDDDVVFPMPQGNDSNTEGLVYTGLPPYYRLGKPINDWDRQRQLWLEKHPGLPNHTRDGRPRLFMLTGSQPEGCKTARGAYLLLKSFKNKMDYCRLHEMEMFYNTAILDKRMDSFWSKLPLLRAAMEAHPEAEWLWWVDADVVITDMEFEIPLERYVDYNLVVPGWEREVYEKRNAMGLNAGSFLVRNCGWTMRFLERWASMGPKGKVRDKAGKLQSERLANRPEGYTGDDQSALIFFMVEEREVWGNKMLVEESYNLNGYWVDVVGGFEEVEKGGENGGAAKKVAEMAYKISGEWETLAEQRRRRRPGDAAVPSFVTHFAGCQPCTGNFNPAFQQQDCHRHMERALALADNQVLRAYGYRHPELDSLDVQRLP